MRRDVLLRNGHAYAGPESLTQRPGGRFNAVSQPVFRMARCLAPPLAELLKLGEREAISGQVKKTVQKHRAVSGGKDEPVPIRPTWFEGIVLHEPCPEHVGHGRSAHGQSGMTGVRFLNSIDGKKPNGIDA